VKLQNVLARMAKENLSRLKSLDENELYEVLRSAKL
jgi:hypothetical protein